MIALQEDVANCVAKTETCISRVRQILQDVLFMIRLSKLRFGGSIGCKFNIRHDWSSHLVIQLVRKISHMSEGWMWLWFQYPSSEKYFGAGCSSV